MRVRVTVVEDCGAFDQHCCDRPIIFMFYRETGRVRLLSFLADPARSVDTRIKVYETCVV